MDALQAPTEATTTPALTTNTPLHSTELSDALHVLTRIRDGKTLLEAATELGISRSTAFRRLRLVEDDTERGVVKLLSAKAIDFAEDWTTASKHAAEKGDHRPAKDALLAIKAIEPVGDSQGGRGITIIIGTPEQPIQLNTPQVIDTVVVDDKTSHER